MPRPVISPVMEYARHSVGVAGILKTKTGKPLSTVTVLFQEPTLER